MKKRVLPLWIVFVLLALALPLSVFRSQVLATEKSFVVFTLSLSQDINMMSVPLDTASVVVGNEIIEKPIKKASDLTAVLGDDVLEIISYNTEEKKFQSFTPGMPEDSPANVDIGRSTGLIVTMKNPKVITFRGNGWPLGPVELEEGMNLISIPLKDSNLTRLSDLAKVLGDKMSLIIWYDVERESFLAFTPTTPPGSPADAYIEGGMSLMVTVTDAVSFDVVGEPWENPPLGDVSCNGIVTSHDAALVLQYIVGLIRFAKAQEDAGDVSGNGTITALDAALVLQYTVGLITQFPVQEAPILTAKDENQSLAKIIAEHGNYSSSIEQKHILEQLKHLLLTLSEPQRRR
jgi:hypothetical protein